MAVSMDFTISKYKNKIPKQVLSTFEKENISELRPPQAMAIDGGLFEDKDLLISSPTASGKTLIAEMSIVNNILNNKGKAVYLCPLRSLAYEKYEHFRSKYNTFKTAISIGDYDSRDSFLHEYDLVITSNEKLDSLLRHGAEWLKQVKSVVIDEIHLINDSHRGHTLEVLTTRLRLLLPDAQFIYLSATVNNSDELSQWLNSKLIKSNYRPVELSHGTLMGNRIDFHKGASVEMPNEEPAISVLTDTINLNKQCIYFVNSRRNAQSLAVKLSNSTKMNSVELDKLSNLILNALETPTEQCEKLANVVKKGVAFHHAGLVMKQRTLIEDSFKKGIIKSICATPTLAMGVNLPAFRVIIKDLKRYSSFGLDWIPVLEYHQIAGRAGRPSYDSEGQVITFSKNEAEKQEILERYIEGEIENIYSKLSAENFLRTHVLALISDLFVRTEDELFDFFKKTFWSFQYSFEDGLIFKLKRVLHELETWKFIEFKNEKYICTPTGKRVSELYLDPLSASRIIDSFKNVKDTETSEMSFLQLICSCLEMWPLLAVYPRHYPELTAKISEYVHYLLIPEPNPFDQDHETYLKSFRTSLLFMDWISELSYDNINKKYRVPPGILHNMLLNSDWLLYSIYELAKIQGLKGKLSEISELRTRIKYGIKRELLELISLRGIGRVRARKLYNNKIQTISDIQLTELSVLSAILGQKTADEVLKQVK